jgi:hypothetical protein
MPVAAFALKKYLAGAVGSKTCDNKHPSPPLGDSEKSRVQSSPRHAIPEPLHFVNEPSEIAALVATKKPWDVFQHQPPWPSLLDQIEIGKGKAATFSCKSCALSGNAKVLAWEAARPDFGLGDFMSVYLRNAA